ncbi:vitellogenin-5-like [Physella acuta]|uniref:vitellogenin-5-like n=1 Tax=Physella acuta TaxID=109671 RepID=UPI0027DB2C2F|nr:vitellogenin-5-like [Physella acuta]
MWFLLLLGFTSGILAFQPNEEYSYSYDVQIVTGLPSESNIYSGFRMHAEARVQFTTYSQVHVQLGNVVLYNIHQPVTQYKAEEYIFPEEFLMEMIGQDTKAIIETLELPFGFEYVEGMVAAITFNNKETEWSANTKRGFISLFELNLNKRNLVEDVLQHPSRNGESSVNSYKVLERSPVGDCLTLYTTVQPPDKQSKFFISKVRDYDNCLDKSSYFKTMFHGYFPTSLSKDNPLSSAANLKYNVKGDNTTFRIQSAVAETKISFSPYWDKGSVITTLNQTLFLLDIKKMSKSTHIPVADPNESIKSSLHMTLPYQAVDSQVPFQTSQEDPMKKDKLFNVYTVDMIQTHLKYAAENTADIASSDSLVHLGIVVEMLSSSPMSVIRELWDKIYLPIRKSQNKLDLAADIFFNVLPFVGTEPAASLILDVCSTDHFMMDKCATAFNVLTLMATPTPELIHKFISLAENNRAEWSTDMKQAVYLSLGSLGFKLTLAKRDQLLELAKAKSMLTSLKVNGDKFTKQFVENKMHMINSKQEIVIKRHEELAQAIVKAVSKLMENETLNDKILCLKALSNSGLPQSVPVLKKVLLNTTEHLYLRVLSILGHQRLYFDVAAKKDAQERMLSVFYDLNETHELRNIAFLVLMHLEPEKIILENIALHLHSELDMHVSNLVQTYLGSFGNSTFYPLSSLAKNCSDALKLAPHPHVDLEHSYFQMMSSLHKGFKMGEVLKISSIGTMNRYESLILNLDTYVYGLYSEFLEIGIKTIDAGHVLSILLGPHGIIKQSGASKKSDRKSGPQEMIEEIYKILKIKPKKSQGPPLAQVYLKLMGHELRYFDLRKYIFSLIADSTTRWNPTEAKLSAELPLEIKTMLYLMNTKLTLPTEAGLPVSLKLKVSLTLNAQGSITLNVTAPTQEKDRGKLSSLDLDLSVDAKPKLTMAMCGSMGLDAHFIQRTMSFNGLFKFTMPIHQNMSYDMMNNKFKLVGHIPNPDGPLVEVTLEPSAESMTLMPNTSASALHLDRTPLSMGQVVPINRFCEFKSVGYKLGLMGHVPSTTPWVDPIRLLYGSTQLSLWSLPSHDTPATVTLIGQIVSSDFNLTSQTEDGILEKLDDAETNSDPIDLKKTSVNMNQLASKFANIFGKPFLSQRQSTGIVLCLDMSTGVTPRKLQLEVIFSSFIQSHMKTMYFRMWESSKDEASPQLWQMVGEFRVTYPFKVHEPQDIFSGSWQQQVMNELQYHVTTHSHQAANEILSSASLSQMAKLNYPAMIKAPTQRVLNNLIPEQLYKMIKTSAFTRNHLKASVISRNWQLYWVKLLPLQHKVSEEKNRKVDQLLLTRDARVLCYLEGMTGVQEMLTKDLEEVLVTGVVDTCELPIVQWLVYNHVLVAHDLDEIVHRYIMNRVMTDDPKVVELMKVINKNMGALLTKMKEVIFSKKLAMPSHSNMTRSNIGMEQDFFHPLHYKIPTDYKRYQFEKLFHSNLELGQTVSRSNQAATTNKNFDEDMLHTSLNNLTLSQMEAINRVHQCLSKKDTLEPGLVQQVITDTIRSLDMFDRLWKTRLIDDKEIIDQMLLVTVQNEFLSHMLKRYHSMEIEPAVKNRDAELQNISDSLSIKINSNFLGQRVASMYREKQMKDGVMPKLEEPERLIYQEVRNICHSFAVDRREFETRLSFHSSAVKGKWEIADLLANLETYFKKLTELEETMSNMGRAPTLYLVMEMLEAIQGLEQFMELGHLAVLPHSFNESYPWIQTLNKLKRNLQQVKSRMSIIFDKYVKEDQTRNLPPLNSVAADLKLWELHHIIHNQNVLHKELLRYLQARNWSPSLWHTLIQRAIDKAQVLQTSMIHLHPDIMAELTEDYSKVTVVMVFSQAIKDQRKLCEIVLQACQDMQDRPDKQEGLLEQTAILLETLDKVEHSLEQRLHLGVLSETKIEESEVGVDDSYSGEMLDEKLSYPPVQTISQQDTSTHLLPVGINGLLNISWGQPDNMKNNFHIQLLATRSVEQLTYLYQQMNSVVRSTDMGNAIDSLLADELWKSSSIRTMLNSYNHLHFVAQYDKKSLPHWLIKLGCQTQELMKNTWWNGYSRHPPLASMTSRQTELVLDISELNQKWDMYLMNERETNKFLNIPLPDIFKGLKPNQNTKPVLNQMVSYLTEDFLPARCIITKQMVRTFDKVTYPIPSKLKKCNLVLAMDCVGRVFAITMETANSSSQNKVINILTEDKMIEVDAGDLDVGVKVDGEVLNLRDYQPITYQVAEYNINRTVLMIEKMGLKIKVDLPMIGVGLVVDTNHVKISISAFFKEQMCGLCGNFDTQMSLEYEGPGHELYPTAKSFVPSYVLPDANCPAPPSDYSPQVQIHKSNKHTIVDDNKEPPKMGNAETTLNECKSTYLNLVKNRKSSKQTCFSEKPVLRCSGKCSKTRKLIPQQIVFLCLPSNDPNIKHYKMEAAHGVFNLPRKVTPADKIVRYNWVPEVCSPDLPLSVVYNGTAKYFK